MKALIPAGRIAKSTGLAAALLVLAGCDAANDAIDAIDDIGNDADVYYYVSLGTSLSVGVQPNSSGTLLPTDDGYPEQLFDLIRADFEAGAPNRELRLRKFGCPGETLDDMINGGSCPYVAGSQLDAAVDFLGDNAEKVLLLTIDIGGNDFRNADCITDAVDLDCVNEISGQIGLVVALCHRCDATKSTHGSRLGCRHGQDRKLRARSRRLQSQHRSPDLATSRSPTRQRQPMKPRPERAQYVEACKASY